MMSDDLPPLPLMNLDPRIPRQDVVKRGLIDFIAEQLPLWVTAYCGKLEEGEDRLTSQLSEYLMEAAHNCEWRWVYFHTQRPDAARKGRTLDMAAKPFTEVIFVEGPLTRSSVLFPIECKRLPTPGGVKREREYVTSSSGVTGGIQRFKLRKHGEDHNLAVMIGYIQQGKPEDWAEKVNDWILDLATRNVTGWSKSDILSVDRAEAELCRLSSNHSRPGWPKDIEVKHLWVRLLNA